ncbi:uridine diphosphate-N-acetylglucosamine-binding protein YvcK [Mycobacterium sp. CBMA293]|uniref:gluconeogenesis factor YvcK family protein n=1 Tax=unclassified Mycolicibacterium TaxID=2636767 RepID=UPI0012DEC414|nr:MULTISPECIES: uridine diphosphate-N-acetylglucosamine-binding protein YvcK [unclassified Mycolicibacterium]MUL48080.1 uridine diphosphate-N-acetylglucosamine-binding protein YvcK [Mycolicibacterium sp. CBMA 360]MUL58258.1 uridine diphosphate-N-acetylglucosamine-binding protein YvcK [Mycolicibacterium sp. CBMA 335]MUL73716.1 uridine diphosphate-N-acetylglucosamine-binding protein YvcK [Mycolicibacterium sp. CBMA 311]MUL93141.1 uridine diphosphate-N-acetylglucosamine-binding protein YvcK [Myco
MTAPQDEVYAPARIVALGGGHGLYATLSAARRLTPHVTAVVTVADDGGSSGRLRSELDVVPPGDLRMALAALASDSPHGQLWATIIQHRFNGSGALAGHPIGNLLLAGLNEVLADPVAALDELGRILGVKGRVLPMCPIALQIEADVSGLEADPRMSRVIRGQVAVATTPGKVRRVRLLPGDPPATRQAVDAIMSADLVVLGPGSWFSSVIPHVLVPQLLAALQATEARRALLLNLAAEPGETAGFSAERHVHVLSQHAPGLTVHDIIVDAASVPSEREREQLRRAAAFLDAQVEFADVSRPGTPLHDPARLAAALDRVRRGGRAPAQAAHEPPTPAARSADGLRQQPTPEGLRGDDSWR